MQTLLFLCTGNYYRSRLAEELFNHYAVEKNLDWRADSAGLSHDFEGLKAVNLHKMSTRTVAYLQERGLPIQGRERLPREITPQDLEKAARIIALDDDEHPPLVALRPWLEETEIEYWDVRDLDRETAEVATAAIDQKVQALVEELGAAKS
ncbi:MAG: low molecular weight phosphatase family protein [Verrucomicrobiota bacterium JB022]|nr:low molecular weight phosphatase family protein [Verrucomicrobiota bacterium JB022]